jgi:hypothetical protein
VLLGDGGRYDPALNDWDPLSVLEAPSARDSQRALWAHGFMLVWGGQDATSALSTGGRYALGQQVDADQDGVMLCADCDDANDEVWWAAGEVGHVTVGYVAGPGSALVLTWTPPADAGGNTPVVYDVLRSDNPGNFLGPAVCLESLDTDLTATDAATPPADVAYSYLVRARNACPYTPGSLGNASNGAPRAGRNCP